MSKTNEVFEGYGRVKAELTNGEIIECETYLTALGEYEEWIEPAPVEWMYSTTECNFDIDETTIKAKYPNEYESDLYSPDKQIKRIVKADDIEWELVA